MKWFLLVVVLVGFVAADDDIECDSLARIKVKNQWNRAYSTGRDREDFAQALWRAYVYNIAPKIVQRRVEVAAFE